MPLLLEMTAREVEDLKGNSGVPFREFMKLVLRAHAHALGVPSNDVVSDTDNMRDGGCDAEVKQSVSSDPSGYFIHRSCWQFKGTAKSNISDSNLRTEINKEYVKSLVEAGYCYNFCIADDLTAQDISHYEHILLTEAHRINPHAPTPRAFGTTSLAAWINLYPAVILTRKNAAVGAPFQHIISWGASACSETSKYVDYANWQSIRQEIGSHIDFNTDVSDASILVGGAAGTGKTRLVYEVISKIKGASALCVYTNDERAAIVLAAELSNQKDMCCILVADECLNQTRHKLNSLLSGAKNRIRIVAINNTEEQTYGIQPEQVLSRLPREVLDEILQKNFPGVLAEIRRAAFDLSEGFVRIAADLCKHGIDRGISRLTEYVYYRISDPRKQKALEILALFDRVGFKEEYSEQMTALSKIIEISEKDLIAVYRELKHSPGFVNEGGRFFYVTPEAVARVCFLSGWDHWVKDSIKEFFDALPESLKESFQVRVSKSAPPEIREAFASALGHLADSFSISDLKDKKKAKQYLELIQTNPRLLLPRFRQLVQSAKDEDIREISGAYSDGWGARRKIVWLCEHLAIFAEYFYDSETILLRLALNENEYNIANNATNIWKQLFRILLSGSSIPFIERLKLLHNRLVSEDERIATLAVGALSLIFSRYASRNAGPSVIAGRIPPKDWRPQTYQEEDACYREALSLLSIALTDSRQIVKEQAQLLFLNDLRLFLHSGYFEFIDNALKDASFRNENLPKILESIEEFIRYDGNKTTPEYRAKIQTWRDSLVPKDDRLARIRSIIGRGNHWLHEPEDREHQTNQIKQFAEEVISDSSDFDILCKWLSSKEAYRAFDFGLALGLRDGQLFFFDRIKEMATNESSALVRGYIAGVAQLLNDLPAHVISWVDDIENSQPELAYSIATTVPGLLNGIDRILRLYLSDKISVRHLEWLSYGYRDLRKDELLRVLNVLIAQPSEKSEEAILVAVNLVSHWLENQKRDNVPIDYNDDALCSTLLLLLEKAIPDRDLDIYHWDKLARFLADKNPQMVIRKSIDALLGSMYIADTGEFILSELTKKYPKTVIEELGKVILDDSINWKLEIRGFTGILVELPIDEIIRWLQCNGIEAVRIVAGNLPHPYIDEQGRPTVPPLTLKVLEIYGGDEDVKRKFGIHTGIRSYSGDIVGQHLAEAKVAEKFLSHPLEAIRFWAELEYHSSIQQAESWKQKIAEGF